MQEPNLTPVSFPFPILVRVASWSFDPDPGLSYVATGTLRFPDGGEGRPTLHADLLAPTGEPRRLAGLIGAIQRRIRDTLGRLLSPRHEGLIRGFLLGDTSGLTPADRVLFRTTGLSHLLAVSGQHLLVLVVVLAAIFSFIGIPPVSRGIVILVFLTGFALISSGVLQSGGP
jgi:competence protein ComEC